MAEIQCRNASIKYRNIEVLSSFSFQIKEGEHTCIQGPMGSGKTILMRSLAGFAQLQGGDIDFFSEGKAISKFEFYQDVSLVEFSKPGKYFNPKNHFYQQRYHHHMEDDFSKSVNIKDLMVLKGFSMATKDVRLYLQRCNLWDHLDKSLIQLSSGQRRKLQLVLSLLHLPKVLLLDSPYIGLDAESREDLNDWLHELVIENNLQIIMVAEERDVPSWIKSRIELPTIATNNANSDNYCMEQIQNSWKDNALFQFSDPLVKLKNIKIKFDKKRLFENVNWTVNQGDRIAIIGNNGAGKSTLISLLNADNPKAYCNNVNMFGVRRGSGDSIWDIKKKTGFISSELHLYFTEKMSCLKVIATGFFDTKFIPRKLESSEIKLIEYYADYFKLSHLLKKDYRQISIGQQKVILFIRAIIKSPPLLLLDEPFQGFDAKSIERAKKLLNLKADQLNTTLIFITHYKDEIPECVNRSYQLEQGKLIKL